MGMRVVPGITITPEWPWHHVLPSSSMPHSTALAEKLPGLPSAPHPEPSQPLRAPGSPWLLWKPKAQCQEAPVEAPALAQPRARRGLSSPFVSTITSPLTAAYFSWAVSHPATRQPLVNELGALTRAQRGGHPPPPTHPPSTQRVLLPPGAAPWGRFTPSTACVAAASAITHPKPVCVGPRVM